MWKYTKSSVQFSGQWQEFRFEDLLQEPWSEPFEHFNIMKVRRERGEGEKRKGGRERGVGTGVG